MTMQHQIEAVTAQALDRAPFTHFDQLIMIHQGQVCILEVDDLSFRWTDASDTVLHKIQGDLSDDNGEQMDWLDEDTIWH
jgi:hypothetical protein